MMWKTQNKQQTLNAINSFSGESDPGEVLQMLQMLHLLPDLLPADRCNWKRGDQGSPENWKVPLTVQKSAAVTLESWETPSG